jgi:putative transposase
MRYQLNSSPHSVYSLNYHLIFCVKYRRKIPTNQISIRLKDIVIGISKDFQVKIMEQETDRDHIHILFKTKPTINITKYINSIKGVSSRILFQEFPEIKMKLWKGHMWSTSYCLLTTGRTTLDVLNKYVESQGNNNDGIKEDNKCHLCGW